MPRTQPRGCDTPRRPPRSPHPFAGAKPTSAVALAPADLAGTRLLARCGPRRSLRASKRVVVGSRVGSSSRAPPLPSVPTWRYTSSLARLSSMSRLRIVSWPMRSSGPNGGVLDPLHRQPLGLVREVRAGGVEDRVVVAAAQAHRDRAGDGRADPAQQRLAEHQALRVEPAALVQQPAEAAAHRAVVLDGVLVVDAGDQPLVGDVQQRHARALVDAAALGLDDAVLDLVAHAEPVAAADRVGLHHEVDLRLERRAVDRRPASPRRTRS